MNEMEMKARLIVDDIKNEEGTSPVAIFKRIFGAALMMVYGFIAFAVAAVGTVVVVIKDRKNKGEAAR